MRTAQNAAPATESTNTAHNLNTTLPVLPNTLTIEANTGTTFTLYGLIDGEFAGDGSKWFERRFKTIEAATAYCAKRGYPLVRTYRTNGIIRRVESIL